jgi:hypothetical protein
MSFDEKVLAVLAQDLGPAAKVFLVRTCRNQLRKEPAQLDKADIPMLANAICLALQTSLGIPLAEKVKNNLMALK